MNFSASLIHTLPNFFGKLIFPLPLPPKKFRSYSIAHLKSQESALLTAKLQLHILLGFPIDRFRDRKTA